ncbi:MAG: hypothetical protein HYW91_01130 [Candidatus Sungbacteria bacterium]|nr:hypothetical protein [Candidatus Sungbacteria bacterium]
MNRQTILLLVFVIVLGLIAYLWYGYAQTATRPETARAEGSFSTRLSELRRLKDLQLDVSLFQDPFFKSLQAPEGMAGEKIREQTKIGRENPFLPF